jgi:hypothetical protein
LLQRIRRQYENRRQRFSVVHDYIQPLARNLIDLIESIEQCVADKRVLPALTLLYCGIDVVASLEQKPKEGSREAFIRWAETYMLNNRGLPCNAIELYASRCGIVHRFSAESKLSRSGRARQIIYAWGNQTAVRLAEASKILKRDDVALHVNDLVVALRNGLADYMDDLERSAPERQLSVVKAAGLWLMHMDAGPVDAFIEAFGGGRQ